MAILKSKRNNLEHDLQKSIVRFFRETYPNYILFSTNNEACYRNSYFLESGVLSGLADLVVILPSKILFVELKTQKGRQSKSQKDFETKITSLGYNYYIIKSLNDFKELIKKNL